MWERALPQIGVFMMFFSRNSKLIFTAFAAFQGIFYRNDCNTRVPLHASLSHGASSWPEHVGFVSSTPFSTYLAVPTRVLVTLPGAAVQSLRRSDSCPWTAHTYSQWRECESVSKFSLSGLPCHCGRSSTFLWKRPEDFFRSAKLSVKHLPCCGLSKANSDATETRLREFMLFNLVISKGVDQSDGLSQWTVSVDDKICSF